MSPRNFISTAIVTCALALGGGSGVAVAGVAEGMKSLEQQKYAEAAEIFRKAFDEGDADASFYLGRMLELGFGAAPNQKAAVAIYLLGGQKGSAMSKNRLGVLHIEGKGVLQDFETGANLICEAAALGDANGAFNCAGLHLEGKGVPKDERKAVALYAQAAENGHVGAMNQYAGALADGKFVAQDLEAALVLYRRTAAQGNPLGLFALGQAYSSGIGVEKDLVEAHAWYNLAAALSHPLAAGARAGLEPRMTSEEITAAQRIAKAWRPESRKDTAAE